MKKIPAGTRVKVPRIGGGFELGVILLVDWIGYRVKTDSSHPEEKRGRLVHRNEIVVC